VVWIDIAEVISVAVANWWIMASAEKTKSLLKAWIVKQVVSTKGLDVEKTRTLLDDIPTKSGKIGIVIIRERRDRDPTAAVLETAAVAEADAAITQASLPQL
jgi:hypothetical protein